MRKSLFLVLPSVLAVLMSASPVLADTPVTHTGNVGPHRLIDNTDRAGMTCRLEQVVEPEPGGGGGWWMLDRISVRPPRMRGTRANQLVAWRFIVQRGKIGTGVGVPPEWKVTYRSPRQYATAGVHSPASFSRMKVPVRVPKPHAGGDSYAYRVKVKMFWYRANGTLQGTASHRVDYAREIPPDDVFAAPCITSRPPAG
jgi:hypothetical protein